MILIEMYLEWSNLVDYNQDMFLQTNIEMFPDNSTQSWRYAFNSPYQIWA